jgi:spore coat polysaccharide biosynthesis protein SpsF
MRPLAGAPVVQRIVERARRARQIDDIVVAMPDTAKDDVLAAHLGAWGAHVFRGSEDDVLARILGAAHAYDATIHIQLWGDTPLLDPEEIDRVVAAIREGDEDLIGNGLGDNRLLPLGLDVIGLRVRALEEADRATRSNAYHREHGTTYVYQTPGAFKVRALETPSHLRYPSFRATIDKEEDYHFAASIYERLYPVRPDFGMREVVDLVRSQPDLRRNPLAAGLLAVERAPGRPKPSQ